MFPSLGNFSDIFLFDSDDSDSGSGGEEEGGDNPLSTLKEKLGELTNAHDLMEKNCHQVTKLLSELEEGSSSRSTAAKTKEKLTLFKLTSAALVKVGCSGNEVYSCCLQVSLVPPSWPRSPKSSWCKLTAQTGGGLEHCSMNTH